jgi:RNA polymerase sigma factor for flagellar operon FliA
MQGERRQMLADAIAELPPREQQVLALYYQEELTMKEVGAVLGVGESRVSQIHSMAVARLRASLESAQQARTAVLTASVHAPTPQVAIWKSS